MDKLTEFGLIENSINNLSFASYTPEEILPEINENTLNCYSVAENRTEHLLESNADAQKVNGNLKNEKDKGDKSFKQEENLQDTKNEMKMQGNDIFDLKSVKVEDLVPPLDIKEEKPIKKDISSDSCKSEETFTMPLIRTLPEDELLWKNERNRKPVKMKNCDNYDRDKLVPAINFQPRVVLEKLELPPNVITLPKTNKINRLQARRVSQDANYEGDSDGIEDNLNTEDDTDVVGSRTLGVNKCDKSNKTFDSDIELGKHFKSCEQNKNKSYKNGYRFDGGANRYTCKACSYKTNLLSRIKQHVSTHSDNRPHACDLCGKRYKSVSARNTHRQVHSAKKKFKCDMCLYTTHKKSSLKTHLVTHSEERSFACPECGGRFKSKQGLRRHKLTHSREKQYKCKLCPYASVRQDCLRIHAAAHTGERIFTCPQCDFATSLINESRNHARVHSRTRILFPCSKCPLRAASMTDLKIHLRVHSGEKPYKCGHCDFATAQRSNLRAHVKLHQGVRRFECAHCSYKVALKANLIPHVQAHLKEKLPYRCAHCDFTARAPFYLIPHIFACHMRGEKKTS